MKRFRITFTFCLICFCFFFNASHAQQAEVEAEEGLLKVNFILKFPDFVEWPPHSVVSDPKFPFIIGVLGETPILPHLIEIAKDKTIKDKKIKIKVMDISDLSGIKECSILFISEFSRRRFKKIMDEIGNLPVLTIGDTEDYARRGVMINMFPEHNFVRFNINSSAAEKNKISINSKILSRAKNIFK